MAYDYSRYITHIFAVSLTLAKIVGLIVGMITQKFQYTVNLIAAALIINIIVFVPSWPFWKKNKMRFLAKAT